MIEMVNQGVPPPKLHTSKNIICAGAFNKIVEWLNARALECSQQNGCGNLDGCPYAMTLDIVNTLAEARTTCEQVIAHQNRDGNPRPNIPPQGQGQGYGQAPMQQPFPQQQPPQQIRQPQPLQPPQQQMPQQPMQQQQVPQQAQEQYPGFGRKQQNVADIPDNMPPVKSNDSEEDFDDYEYDDYDDIDDEDY